jgi:hypothetical protein
MSISTRKCMSDEHLRPSEDHTQILSVDDASMMHAGEWVLMRITGMDEQRHTFVGEVLHHGRSRKVISKYVEQAHKQDPRVHLLVTLGGTRSVSAEEWRRGIVRLTTEEYINARW